MAKLPNNTLLFLRRRLSTVGAEHVKTQQAAAPVRIAKTAVECGIHVNNVEEKTSIFWMKDPKTGNWIPESHFGDVDVVELREKLLTKRKQL